MTARRTPTGLERAFTLIEMIIVLVLLAVAMAAIFPAIGNMLRGNSRSAASSQATGEAGIAARQLEEDIRVALGNRGTGERVTTSSASLPTATSTIASLTLRNASVSDIVEAGPTRLYLNADVYPNPGIERVEWELLRNNAACGDRDRTTNSNFCLQRRVRSAGGALLTSEVPTHGRGTYPVNTSDCAPGAPSIGTPRVFCYQEAVPGNGAANNYVWNSGWTTTCTTTWNQGGPGTSPNLANVPLASNSITTVHNAVDPATAISRLDRIVGVGATMIVGGSFGKSGERTYDHVNTVVRAREGEAYREAIMCGTRAGWGR